MYTYVRGALSTTLTLAPWIFATCATAQVSGDLLLEELVVTGQRDTRIIDVTEALSISPDAAMLLHAAPGANVTTNGPITGIPQYRGLFGPRIAVSLDGSQLAPAGPNWMDPPISYAVTAQLESLEVYRGIAPVSIAQETLGGAIDARTRRMAFTDNKDFSAQGRMVGSAQSVNSGYQLDAELQLANDQHRFRGAAMAQEGEDTAFPAGEVLPSSYDRARYDLGYGFRSGAHTLQFDYGYNDTGEAGTPALPMDIDYFEGDLLSASYRFDGGDTFAVEGRVYGSSIDHGMTNFHLRQAPAAPARWRQNIASTDNLGFKLEASWLTDGGQWRAGIDGFSETHDSNIDNPNNPMFFVVNFSDAERDVYGLYLEHGRVLSNRWSAEFGLRVNRVGTDSGEVNGTPAMMMPPAQALRDAFNAADRSQAEINVDALMKLTYRYGANTHFYAGLAQKQRGPTYQERYLWLPLEATAGLADGQLYLGNIGLESERATQFEFGWDWSANKVSMHPRFFYYRINDFIQGTTVDVNSLGAGVVRIMNASNGVNRPDPLRFNNVEAELYGFDMDWSVRFSDSLSLSGLVNVVRGERRDIDDDLYRIAPPNMTIGVDYASSIWSARLETVLYAGQDDVSVTNREQTTAGYATVNLHAAWQASESLQLALGVDNLLDREYAPHLGGYNRVMNPDVGMLERLPAAGANVFGRVVYQF